MRTKKLVVLAVAGLGAAGALAVSGVALADEVDPRSELHIVSHEPRGAANGKDCPERAGDGGSPAESEASGSANEAGQL